MKKLVIALPNFGGGGAEKVMVNLANEFDRRKFDIYFLILSDNGPYKQMLSQDIKLVNLNTKRVRKSRKKIISILNEIEPDIIFSTQEHLNILLLHIKNKLSSDPQIYIRLTNTLSQTLKNMSKIKAFIWYKLINYYYPKADHIIAQCNEMKIDFLKLFNIEDHKIKYIYNPLNLKSINKAITNKNPYNTNNINYLAVGSLTYQKGFDVLIESFAKVKEVLPDSKLIILGEGKLETELRMLCKELKVDKHVSFEGFVENPYDYYYYSDVYVLSSRFEGFPNSLLEALACHTKVVSTSCKSGPTEILNNQYGLIAAPEDPNSLAMAMINAYKNPNMSSNRAEDFEIEKITQQYENVLLNI